MKTDLRSKRFVFVYIAYFDIIVWLMIMLMTILLVLVMLVMRRVMRRLKLQGNSFRLFFFSQAAALNLTK